mgnify:CR=1 FL=1
MNTVELIKTQLLDNTNYITTNSVIEALENEELFDTLRAYHQLNLNKQVDFRRLISKDFIDDLTFSLLIKLSDKEKKELLKLLKPSQE